jgi:hypothetical protein
MRNHDSSSPVNPPSAFLGHREVARACFERILAWEPDLVLIAHGRPYERDTMSELRRPFRWTEE